MKVDDSVSWGVGRGVGSVVDRVVGGEVYIGIGDEVGEGVELKVWRKDLLIDI